MQNVYAVDPLNKEHRAEVDDGLMAVKGSANAARVGYALDDSAAVEAIAEVFRDHLLAALSEARSMSVGMDGNVREKLMDELTKHLHPDGVVGELIADAFKDTRSMVADRVELVAAE